MEELDIVEITRSQVNTTRILRLNNRN